MADLKKDNEKLSREVGAMDGLTGSALSHVAVRIISRDEKLTCGKK